MGFRVESRMGNAILKNPRLLKIGIKFQFPEIMNKVSRHLISNLDKVRQSRKDSGQVSQVNWTPCRTIDNDDVKVNDDDSSLQNDEEKMNESEPTEDNDDTKDENYS